MLFFIVVVVLIQFANARVHVQGIGMIRRNFNHHNEALIGKVAHARVAVQGVILSRHVGNFLQMAVHRPTGFEQAFFFGRNALTLSTTNAHGTAVTTGGQSLSIGSGVGAGFRAVGRKARTVGAVAGIATLMLSTRIANSRRRVLGPRHAASDLINHDE